MRNSISKRMSSWFAALPRKGAGVRAVKLAVCAALLVAAAGAQPSADWRIDTFAGTGEPGHGGDGRRAVEARLSFPSGVAVDNSGKVYIADFFIQRIRRVDTTGTITTIAGTGEPGYGGDGGRAVESGLSFPSGVAADHAGNIYITDTGNNRVRRIDTTGTITTIAGTDEAGYDWDGPAVEAQLTNPKGVAVDYSGNLYFAGFYNFGIRRVDATGTMSRVTGSGEPYDGPDDESRFSRDRGIAVDDAGNVYIANIDNNYIRRVDATGTVSVIAGTPGEPGYGGDGVPAVEAQLSYPADVAVDDAGNVYIADSGNHRIRRIDTAGTITTIAGTGEPGYGGDGGPSVEAQLASPFALTVESSGKIYVADLGNYRIRVLTQSMDSGGGRAPLLEEIGGLLPLRSAVRTGKAASQYPQTTHNLVIVVPEGGTVGTLSNTFSCGAGETCEIPIDEEFHEVFVPQPKVGYRFSSWKQSSDHFCGGQIVNCTITADTADSLSRLEPIFGRDVASTGYRGIRRLDYSDMDVNLGWPFFGIARAYTDFDGDGVLDLFRAIGKWQSVERQHLEMWLGNGDGTYRRDDGMLANPTVGGFHSRKAVIADFNGDDRADVIVADHGYDARPFPGAPLLLYLSTADGRLEKAKGLEHTLGFHHGASAGDIDGDGDTDAFMMTSPFPVFLLNDGNGNMISNRSYLPKLFRMDHGGYYTSELIDVDRDGKLDLLVAGHEFDDASSVIVWGSAEPGFTNSPTSTLPEVTEFGIVVDIDVGDFDGDGINDVLLNRAGSPPAREFYGGMYLQVLKGQEDRRTFSDVTESSIDNDELLNTYDKPGNSWFEWLILQDWDFDGDLDIVVDDLRHTEQGLVLINDGKSVFSILELPQP